MDILALQSKLDQQAAWRKRELYQARSLANSAGNDEAQKYLCRVWVMILYAHCDNFLKESAKHYIKYLQLNRSQNYKPELIWLAMKGKEAITVASEDTYLDFNAFSQVEPYKFMDEKLLNTIFDQRSFQYKSLRFICDWVLQIKFNHSKLSAFCNIIKETRDSIAHGEERYIETVEDCLPWHATTIEFIDSLKDSLIENATKI
jgi:hypothetical protein